MTKDKGSHKKIREDMHERLKDLKNINNIYCSHGEDGDIYFFRKNNGKRIEFARPDIVVNRKDNHVLVIEIELSVSPKHLMGVASAVYLSEYRTHKRKHINIEKKSLLLVLKSDSVCKEGSGKPDQIKEIKSLIRKKLNFENFNITTDNKAIYAINEWVKDKMEDEDICV